MTQYFSMAEIRCPCGCECVIVDDDFLEVMNLIRAEFGQPIIVNSWYRCEEYDKSIGGKGAHRTGVAADIRCLHSLTRWRLVTLAQAHQIDRIGIGDTFLHLDMHKEFPAPRMWTY